MALHTTPATSPAPALPISSDSSDDSNMTLQSQFFWGDGRADDWVPGDYLKSIMNMFRETSLATFKASKLGNGLATNSVVETWFEELDTISPGTKGNWAKLEAAFKARWPKQAATAQTVEQW